VRLFLALFMHGLFSAPIASGKPTVFPILPPRRTPVLRPSPANGAEKLFFRLLMDSLFPAPFAVFFDLDLALYQLFIFAAPVVNALTFRAGQSYEKIL